MYITFVRHNIAQKTFKVEDFFSLLFEKPFYRMGINNSKSAEEERTKCERKLLIYTHSVLLRMYRMPTEKLFYHINIKKCNAHAAFETE